MANTILGKLLIQIAGNTVELNKSLASTQTQISGFQKSISATQKLIASIGVGVGFTQMLGLFKSGVNTIKDFEKQMSSVRAITNATDKEFNQLKDSALELGRTTKFTSQEVAELQTEFARLGFSTQEILDATEATINLSIATGSDLAQAAEVAGSTIRGFGLNADQTSRVVDVMAESFNKSALGIENFSEAMKYVAPIAKQAGLSVEETTALLGTLADAGIKGSSAGTSLRKIISDLGTESGDLSERIEKLAAKGLTGADAMDEVGRTAYASLLVLAENAEKTDELTIALNNAAGAGERAAKIMGDNLAGDLDELDSAYEGLILTMSDSTSVFREIVQAGTKLIQMLSDQDTVVGSLVQKWLYLVTTVPRTIGNIIGYVADLGGATEDAAKKAEELAEKNRAIDSTAKAAFDSGNVEAYIKALDQNIYKEEIIAKIRARQAEEAKKPIPPPPVPQLGLIEALEEKVKKFQDAKEKAFSTDEVARLNDKIQDLKDQLDLLNSSTANLSGFGKQVMNAEAGTIKVDQSELATPEGLNFQLPAIEPPDMTATMEAFEAVKKQYEETGLIAFNQSEQMALAWDLQTQKQQKATNAALEWGSVLGDAFAMAVDGNKSLLQILGSTLSKVVGIFFSRAIAGTIAGAAETTAPPPVILALAAAGIAGITAMFGKIDGFSGGGGGGGGGGLSSISANPMRALSAAPIGEEPQQVEFFIHGDDLATSASSQAHKNDRLGG